MAMLKGSRASADAPPSFWVVVEDHGAKLFDVIGPLDTDVQWTNRATLARERGRDVTICTVTSEADAILLTRELASHGFVKSEVAIL